MGKVDPRIKPSLLKIDNLKRKKKIRKICTDFNWSTLCCTYFRFIMSKNNQVTLTSGTIDRDGHVNVERHRARQNDSGDVEFEHVQARVKIPDAHQANKARCAALNGDTAALDIANKALDAAVEAGQRKAIGYMYME